MIKINVQLCAFALLLFSSTSTIYAQQGTVSIEQPTAISTLLEFKKDLRTVDAFIIQVYNGPRSGAQSTKSQVEGLFPEWSNSIEYEQPNYKIWVGNFRTRLEADRALMQVKKSYANAFILRPRKNK